MLDATPHDLLARGGVAASAAASFGSMRAQGFVQRRHDLAQGGGFRSDLEGNCIQLLVRRAYRRYRLLTPSEALGKVGPGVR